MTARTRILLGLAPLWLSLAGCAKASVEGAYTGTFQGTLMTPSPTGGMSLSQAGEAAEVTLTGSGPETSVAVAWTFRPSGSSTSETPVKCTLKARRTGDPGASKGDAELTIEEQECAQASGPPLKLEGKLEVLRKDDAFDALSMELKSVHRWGGPGQPRLSFFGTVKAQRQKR